MLVKLSPCVLLGFFITLDFKWFINLWGKILHCINPSKQWTHTREVSTHTQSNEVTLGALLKALQAGMQSEGERAVHSLTHTLSLWWEKANRLDDFSVQKLLPCPLGHGCFYSFLSITNDLQYDILEYVWCGTDTKYKHWQIFLFI